MAKSLNLPKIIYLYNEGLRDLDFKKIRLFIQKNFGKFPIRLIRLKERVVQTKGILFDFIKTNQIFERLKTAKTKESCHIILTPKLFATFDEQKKLHIRAVIFSFPSVISTSGIVEGPAKPKEYYLYKQKYSRLGIWEIEEAKVKERFKTRFIDYADKRIREVLKGYISQALFFYITNQPFCKQKSCRLFNAHWQEDLIYSQIREAKFCKGHKRVLEKIKNFS